MRFIQFTICRQQSKKLFLIILKHRLAPILTHWLKLNIIMNLTMLMKTKKSTVFFNKLAGINNVKKALDGHDYDGLREAVIAMAKIAIPTTPDKENLNYTALRKQCVEIEDLIAAFYPEAVMVSDAAAMLPLVQKLVNCVLAYMEIYEKIKEAHEVIDFSDMEHMALKILHANNGYVASLYRNQFKEIMVDEFQDSNDVQDELVLSITRGNNVFRVGDVKQSIYGFRYASPAIMQGYKELNDELNELIVFKKNYRSSETIVRFNNVLYEKLMNVDGFKSLPFLNEDLASIGGPWQQKVLKPICFHALNYKDITEGMEADTNKDELKASYIANQILEIKEREGYQFKDFVVLVRGNAKMEVLKKVFDEINLPCTMNSKHGFYESYGIQILLSALTCFINPRDDLNFTAILTSPFFNMSSEALADLKLSRQNQEHFYDTLKRLKPDALAKLKKSDSIIQTVFANVLTRALIGMISIKVPARSVIKPTLIYYLKKSRFMKKSMAAASPVF